MPRFAVFHKNKVFQTFDISKDLILIGRLWGLDIELPRPAVSRKHARIMRDGKVFVIEDLGSTNGFTVNGEKTKFAVLKPDDKIQIEHFVIVFEPKKPPAEKPSGRAFPPANEKSATATTKSLDDEDKHDADLTFIDIARFLK
jgi:pSer/pThr/pTyr-binding forkhead associated (FHA) protein